MYLGFIQRKHLLFFSKEHLKVLPYYCCATQEYNHPCIARSRSPGDPLRVATSPSPPSYASATTASNNKMANDRKLKVPRDHGLDRKRSCGLFLYFQSILSLILGLCRAHFLTPRGTL